jgi:hypothetical protein
LSTRQPFDMWLRLFPTLARDLEAEGVPVVNASRATALTCFARAALEDAIDAAP